MEPLRSTRACVSPALEVKGVPTGTTALHTYLSDLSDTEEWGHTAYTDSALSLVLLLRSSEPLGCSPSRQAQASTDRWRVPRLLARCLDADAVGDRRQETAPAFLAHRVHAAPGLLAELPAGRVLAGVAREKSSSTMQSAASATRGRAARRTTRTKRAQAYSMPGYRPRRHH